MKEEWKVYIKAVPGRGEEVIKALTDLGGLNVMRWLGDAVTHSVLVLTASLAKGVSVNRWNGREWLYTGDVDYWMPIPELTKGGEE